MLSWPVDAWVGACSVQQYILVPKSDRCDIEIDTREL